MGLSIHYHGQLKKADLLPGLMEETGDIARIFGWEHTAYEGAFPEGHFGKETYNSSIYGISINIPECETVFLSFLSNGRMSSPMNLDFYGNSQDEKDQEYLYFLSVKTQFAGVETHKKLVHLFKYLNEKYFRNFEFSDEGHYWETGAEKLLKEGFDLYNKLLDTVQQSLQEMPLEPGESYEDYFGRLLTEFREKRGKGGDH